MYDIITQPRLLEYFLSCERFLYKRFLHDSFRVYTDRRIPFNEEDNAIIKKKEKNSPSIHSKFSVQSSRSDQSSSPLLFVTATKARMRSNRRDRKEFQEMEKDRERSN